MVGARAARAIPYRVRRRGLDLSALGDRPVLLWTAAVLVIAVIAGFDYASGTELRTYPLYFGPVALLAWHAGHRGNAVASILSVTAWGAANWLAGMQFTNQAIWPANALVHGSAFLLVGYLIARLQHSVVQQRQLSRTDSLTGLRNSRAFYDEAPPLLALCARRGRPVTLAYLDLDSFKAVNDELGHQAGDDMLRRVADRLRDSLRPSDMSARLGGDEFVVLFPELDREGAQVALERLRSGVAEAAHAPSRAVSVSIGAVTLAGGPFDLEAMVHQADELMYKAKSLGRNRVAVQEPVEPLPDSRAMRL